MCSNAVWFSNGCLLHQGKANVLALVPSPSHVPGISLSFSKCTAQRMSFWQTPQVWSWVRATREAISSSRPALGWWEWSPNITSPSQWSTFSVRSSMMSLRSLMVSKSTCALLKIAQTGFKTPGVYDATSQLGLSRCSTQGLSLPQKLQCHGSWWVVWAGLLMLQPRPATAPFL